jgi:hypothetical protein
MNPHRRAVHSSTRIALLFIPFLIGLGAFCLYIAGLPSQYTNANQSSDAGDLLTAVITGGVPHPTGYPTYLLISTLFQRLPFGTPFLKNALVSAFFASLAVAMIAYLALTDKRNSARRGDQFIDDYNHPAAILACVFAALALCVSPYYWSQAVIVEVYGLQTFFTAVFLFWLKAFLHPHQKPGRKLFFLSILLGLGLGNHITLILFFPAVFFVVQKEDLPRLLKSLGVTAFCTVLVYSILPLRAASYPPVNWGNPQNIPGLIWLVSGRLYQGLAFGLPLAQIPSRISFWAGWWFQQFTPLGVLFGVIGLVESFENRHGWTWVWLFAVSSVFSIGYLTNDSIVYLLPAAMVFALWISNGIHQAWTLPGRLALPARLVVAAFVLMVVLRIPATFRDVDPREDKKAGGFAENCLSSLPTGALVLTETDTDTFPLWYAHFGLRQRTDIAVVARGLTEFSWYRTNLQHTYPALKIPTGEFPNWENQLASLNPVYQVCHCPYESGQAICSPALPP